jgi:hypothetical protein
MTKVAPVVQHRHKPTAIACVLTILHDAMAAKTDPRPRRNGFRVSIRPGYMTRMHCRPISNSAGARDVVHRRSGPTRTDSPLSLTAIPTNGETVMRGAAAAAARHQEAAARHQEAAARHQEAAAAREPEAAGAQQVAGAAAAPLPLE